MDDAKTQANEQVWTDEDQAQLNGKRIAYRIIEATFKEAKPRSPAIRKLFKKNLETLHAEIMELHRKKTYIGYHELRRKGWAS